MNTEFRRKLFSLSMSLFLTLLFVYAVPVRSGDPHLAYYSPHNDQIFWFMHISDMHIGAEGEQDSDNFRWLVNEARNIINPDFIVASGDLTDSTNGNDLGIPNGPYQEEWIEYRAILDAARIGTTFYYDIPGNHEAYNDANFVYYLANSVQGQATGQTQVSWIREFNFGKYHFLGINTADNTGSEFSVAPPFGDLAGLDETELTFIKTKLEAHQDADLTFLFGHHSLTGDLFTAGLFALEGIENITETFLAYGMEDIVSFLDRYGASFYGYGHTHGFEEDIFSGDDYTGYMKGDGVYYLNTSSLGKSDKNQYSIIAVDNNGISIATPNVETWPVVMITTPLSNQFGGVTSPFSYIVPKNNINPLRALVFDSKTIEGVTYRVDESNWRPMKQVTGNPRLWEAQWDASSLTVGEHTLEVRADSDSGTGTATIQVDVAKMIYISSSGNCGERQQCFTSIQDAIYKAWPGATIWLSAGIYDEMFTLKMPKSLVLEGGWDLSFTDQTGATIMRKAPEVQKGMLTVRSLRFRPQ